MESRVTLKRTCELSFTDVSQLLRSDAAQAIRASSSTVDTRMPVHLNTRLPLRSRDDHVTARVGKYETVDGHEGRMNLRWEAAQHKRLLPAIDGHLEIRSLSHDLTELEYDGRYSPAFGLLGRVEDSLMGHNIIEDAVGQLLDGTIGHLRDNLNAPL